MKLDANRAWLEGVRRVPSPNSDRRPRGCEVDLVVVHGISVPAGRFGGPWIDALFSNRLDPRAHPSFLELADLRVSAHVLIRRDGELVQYVPFTRRAWHAGASSFQGRERCNDFSIGIELEGADEVPYEAVQYHRLAELTARLAGAWPGIGPDRVVGHSSVAPGRKTDPGPAFDWARLRRLLVARLGGDWDRPRPEPPGQPPVSPRL